MKFGFGKKKKKKKKPPNFLYLLSFLSIHPFSSLSLYLSPQLSLSVVASIATIDRTPTEFVNLLATTSTSIVKVVAIGLWQCQWSSAIANEIWLLLVKFDAHINVELCNYSRSVKYLFKYLHKGSDRTTATMESIDTATEIDEIKTYLDCRYISATEACWRIFQFDIHYREPAVERLLFHLPGEHTVIFEENNSVENVLSMPGIEKTKFTKWFETNKKYDDARELTYSDFPTCWVWNAKDKIWTRRKKGKAIGRIYFAHPSSGERFYMRMLLNFVKGSTSYKSIRTINGVTYPTFKAACYALGLLDDDKEWNDCLTEAALWATGNELRHLFVTILIHCQVSNACLLWKSNYTILSEDITSLQRKRFRLNHLLVN